MRVKLFTLRYSSTLGGFDDTPLQDFTRDKELVAFREHFYAVNEVPHVSCVLTYQDAVVPQAIRDAAHEVPRRPEHHAPHAQHASNSRFSRDNRPDPTEGLSEPERILFNTLRDWRSKKAHEEGVPVYLIFSNRELLEIVRRRPDSPTALGHLHGIGPGKVKRHGQDVLRALHGSAVAARTVRPIESGPAIERDASTVAADGQRVAVDDGPAVPVDAGPADSLEGKACADGGVAEVKPGQAECASPAVDTRTPTDERCAELSA